MIKQDEICNSSYSFDYLFLIVATSHVIRDISQQDRRSLERIRLEFFSDY